jgi:hypothetical protein
MKATVIVNRHIVTANKKESKEDPVISVNTYKGVIYGKVIEFLGASKLIQDVNHPRSCGATVWLECQLEELLIDGTPGQEALQLILKSNI